MGQSLRVPVKELTEGRLISASHSQSIGDTVFVMEDARPVAFAICHCGSGSEAFADDELLVKFAFVHPDHPRADVVFRALLTAAEGFGSERGMKVLGAMASAARRATVEALLSCGYLVAQMHQQQIWMPGCSASESLDYARQSFSTNHFALAEWR